MIFLDIVDQPYPCFCFLSIISVGSFPSVFLFPNVRFLGLPPFFYAVCLSNFWLPFFCQPLCAPFSSFSFFLFLSRTSLPLDFGIIHFVWVGLPSLLFAVHLPLFIPLSPSFTYPILDFMLVSLFCLSLVTFSSSPFLFVSSFLTHSWVYT